MTELENANDGQVNDEVAAVEADITISIAPDDNEDSIDEEE